MSKSWLRTDNESHGIGPLFDLAAGRTLRDEGIKQVSEHNEPWVDRCRRSAEQYLNTCASDTNFTGETIRFWCRYEVGEPTHPNGWGALINSLVKRGVIYPTGQYVQPKDKTSHARAIQVYRKV